MSEPKPKRCKHSGNFFRTSRTHKTAWESRCNSCGDLVWSVLTSGDVEHLKEALALYRKEAEA